MKALLILQKTKHLSWPSQVNINRFWQSVDRKISTDYPLLDPARLWFWDGEEPSGWEWDEAVFSHRLHRGVTSGGWEKDNHILAWWCAPGLPGSGNQHWNHLTGRGVYQKKTPQQDKLSNKNDKIHKDIFCHEDSQQTQEPWLVFRIYGFNTQGTRNQDTI